MASRENQGLQIAVMIFFLLVVLLAVTTYVYFKSSTDLQAQVVKMQEESNKNETRFQGVITELGQLRKLMGFNPDPVAQALGNPETPEPESIMASFRDDMEKYAGNVEKKDYREVVTTLHTALVASQLAEADAKEKADLAAQQFKDVEGTKDQQITKFRDDAAKAATEVEAAKTTFTGAIDESNKVKDQLAGQLEAKRTEMDEKVSVIEKDRTELGTQLQKARALVKSFQEKEKTESAAITVNESPDGEVTWVNQRSRIVWINLGSEDKLVRQTMFSVFPVDSNQSPDLSRKKGSVEVTRVIDGHLSEARIVEDSVQDPLLPGDKILSPVWDRGRTEGFALAGFMDIDGDGRSDRNKVRELIKLNGGRVDAEVDDDGKLTGKIELTTRYIVLGNPPTDKSTKQELLDNFSLLTGQAQDLTIEKITVQKFVQQMGYKPEERTVPLGSNARPEDFTAKPKEGVQRKSTGNTSDTFKPREAPRRTTF